MGFRHLIVNIESDRTIPSSEIDKRNAAYTLIQQNIKRSFLYREGLRHFLAARIEHHPYILGNTTICPSYLKVVTPIS